MKATGTGLARVGTLSFKVALEELGVGPSFRALGPAEPTQIESKRPARSSSTRSGAAARKRPQVRARRPARRTGARIVGLTLADYERSYSQDEVLERLGLGKDEFARRIFERSGVQRRHLNLEPDFLAQTLQGRGADVEAELLARSVDAVDRLGVDPAEIGVIVSASLYSLGCPSLAHRLIEHYAMDPAIDKYHITGVGCASAVPLLRLTAQTLHEHPGRYGLVVAAESMSSIMMPATPQDERAKTVGSAIFGDGCAAALISGDPVAPGPMILASQVHQIGGTLDAVSLSLSPSDSHLHLSRELPDLAGAGLGALVEEFLRRNRMERAAIDHWIVHPGGRRIVENVQDALGLSYEEVELTWQALADHGNVGTPSILYVLRATLDERRPRAGERGLMVTIGPGVSVGLMLLQF